jgi:hypothetical protein
MNKGKIACGVLSIGLFVASSNAQADDSVKIASLLANINAGYAGAEVIMPYFKYSDANNDGYYESLTFWHNIYQNNTTTKLYSNTAKAASFPAVSCTNPYWKESYSNPQFVRSSSWVITGNDMTMECESPSGHNESHNTFIYSANSASATGVVNTFIVNNARLNSVELADYNSDGVQDLIITMNPQGVTTDQVRVVVKNISNWSTISDKTYVVGNIN